LAVSVKRALQRIAKPFGAVVGLTGATALVNNRLRATSAIPHDHIGGKRLRWTWRGYEIFATELGSGPPVLLVHGIYAGASAYEFRKIAPLLARHHRVIAFGLLGCGLSEMPDLDYTPELLVEQIVDAIGEFTDGPMTLIASSLGAAFAVRAATRAPERVRRLVLICPAGLGGVLDDPASAVQNAIRALVRSPLAGEAAFNALASPPSLRWFLETQSFADRSLVDDAMIEHYYAVTHQPGARFVPAAFVGGALNCNVARALPFVPAPILVVWGGKSSRTNPLENAAEYVRLAKDGRLVTLPESGLQPHDEAPAATARLIDEFIDEPAAQRSGLDSTGGDVSAIFKSYDVRGIYPAQINEELAYRIGRLVVPLVSAKSIVVGRDMRPSGKTLFEAFARGVMESGADVTDIGEVSTDALYFAVGQFGFDGGVMITASHNPANYNGMKFTRAQAMALSLSDGLSQIRDGIADPLPEPVKEPGTIARRDILDEFAAHCLSFVDPKAIKPFKIAIDAGNGMAGKTIPYVFKHLPCEVVPLYFELDGEFPNHPASPIEPENMVDVQRAVREHRCDLGVAFDGDADRMFIVDENGALIGGDIVTLLVGLNTLKRDPGAKILYNLICSRSVPEGIARAGGVPVRAPVGHSLIKKIMRDENVAFGGEHSGHFYFRDNWFADSGMIALMQCLEVFSDAGKPVSEVIAPLDSRYRSGEINSRVGDIPAKIAELLDRHKDALVDHLDGVTIAYPDWWMNVRPSNTEPLLRLNVEGATKATMEQHRDEALALIRS
jgi:phosphomannomutase